MDRLSSYQKQICSAQLPNDDGGFRYCTGPTVYGEAEVETWPQFMVFDVNGRTAANNGLDILPFSFTGDVGMKFVLRGAIVGDTIHFRSLIRCETNWMVYDGMWAVPRFRMFPKTWAKEALGNYTLNVAIYEVMGENEKGYYRVPEFNLESAIVTDKLDVATQRRIIDGRPNPPDFSAQVHGTKASQKTNRAFLSWQM